MDDMTNIDDFGDVGQARLNFDRMSRGMIRLQDIAENVEVDPLKVEKYVKELTNVVREMFLATISMFTQERMRFAYMLA